VASARRQRLRGLALLVLLVAAVLLFAPAQFWERQATTLEYESDASAQGRLQAWGVAFNIGLWRPLGGVGVGAFTHAWALHAPLHVGHYAYVAHNLFLEVLGETGVFGLAAFAAFTVLVVRGAWRATRSESVGNEARAVLAGTLGLLTCQMTSGFKLSTGLYLLCGMAAVVDRLAARGEAARQEAALASPMA
jgi:O-antigen ligase